MVRKKNTEKKGAEKGKDIESKRCQSVTGRILRKLTIERKEG